MRKEIVLISLATLAGCSGGGPQTVGGNAAPAGSGVVGGGTTTAHSFVNPTEKKTYSAIGGAQSYQYSTSERTTNQFSQLYAGDASTARNSGITVAYDPRDAIFEVTIASSPAGVDQTLRFQDPAHRTDFGGQRAPQGGTPNIANKNIQYLQAGGTTGPAVSDPTGTFLIGNNGASRDVSTFFYQKPGTGTKYVTFAGFVRNTTSVVSVAGNGENDSYFQQNHVLERAAFAFGERTQNNAVPRTGSASYTGDMLATMVYNPLIDTQANAPTYYQWIDGTAAVNVNFATNAVTTTFTGTVFAPQLDIYTTGTHAMPAGSTFNAAGTANVDLVNAGGFLGQINTASFTNGGGTTNVAIAGSSLDGAFYGPAADEVGGGFRIVGGNPDERIDILGTFTAAKP